MKRVFLLIVLPVLLVALGFAQTPAATGNTDPINIKGCLAGSDGNYTVAEDATGQIFKITASSADLKPHLGQDVKLIGHKAIGTASSGAAENSLAVTEVNVISEHCTATGAAPAAAPTATVSTPTETTVTPAPAVATPAATVSTPAETTIAPPATVATPAETVTTPAAAAAAPAATLSTPAETTIAPPETVSTPAETVTAPTAATPAAVSTPPETASTPAAATTHPKRLPAHPGKPAATPAAAAKPAESVSTPVVPTDTTPAAAVSTPSASDSTPAAAPTKPATKAWSGSLWILVAFVVVVLVIGAMVPVVNKWKKRRLLERASAENLSFSHRAISDPGRIDKPTGRKAA
jgi:hypothetical protein